MTPEHLLGHARHYRLPKVVAVHYLSAIASLIGERQKTDLFAEEKESAQTAVAAQGDVIGRVATATLEAYLPSDLTIEKIVELRQVTEQQRLQYQGAIASIVDEVQKVSSIGELEKVARRAEDLAKLRIEETQKRYQQAKLGSVVKLLGVSLAPPGVAAYVASVLGVGVFMPAAVGAALCLAGAELLSSRDKAKVERDNTKWSLIFRVSGQ